jgi:hypothetical protein
VLDGVHLITLTYLYITETANEQMQRRCLVKPQSNIEIFSG